MQLNELAQDIHARNVEMGWWPAMEEEFIPFLIGTKLALVHSEVTEAMEGYRTDSFDDKLPEFKQFDVEVVDALIRLLDIAGRFGMDLDGIMIAKRAYNAVRSDHKVENRKAKGGKKF